MGKINKDVPAWRGYGPTMVFGHPGVVSGGAKEGGNEDSGGWTPGYVLTRTPFACNPAEWAMSLTAAVNRSHSLRRQTSRSLPRGVMW